MNYAARFGVRCAVGQHPPVAATVVRPLEGTDARPPRAGDGRVRALRMCMEESTHSRFAEMSDVLPHPTLLVVMGANVRDMICG